MLWDQVSALSSVFKAMTLSTQQLQTTKTKCNTMEAEAVMMGTQ